MNEEEKEQSLFENEPAPEQSTEDYFESLRQKDLENQEAENRHDYTEPSQGDLDFQETLDQPETAEQLEPESDEATENIENREGPIDRLKNKVDEIRDDLRDRF